MTLDDIVIDTEFKSLCPPLTEDELSELAVSISKEGFRDPLVRWGNLLIDGHNRYEIWSTHYSDDPDFKPPSIVSREFKGRDAAKEWIIRNQFARRNLTTMQRAELALKLKPLIEKRAKANQKARKGSQAGSTCQISDKLEPVDTKKELATIAGVSHDTIAKVETILKSKDKYLIEEARTGEKSVNSAAKEARQRMPRTLDITKQEKPHAGSKKPTWKDAVGERLSLASAALKSLSGHIKSAGDIAKNVELFFVDTDDHLQAISEAVVEAKRRLKSAKE